MIFEHNYRKIILTRMSINYLYVSKFCCISKLSLNKEKKVSKLWIATRKRATMHGVCLEGQQNAESAFSRNSLT